MSLDFIPRAEGSHWSIRNRGVMIRKSCRLHCGRERKEPVQRLQLHPKQLYVAWTKAVEMQIERSEWIQELLKRDTWQDFVPGKEEGEQSPDFRLGQLSRWGYHSVRDEAQGWVWEWGKVMHSVWDMCVEEQINHLGRSGLWLVFTQVQRSGERCGPEILNTVHWGENASGLMITCNFFLTNLHLRLAVIDLTWTSKQSYLGLIFRGIIKF